MRASWLAVVFAAAGLLAGCSSSQSTDVVPTSVAPPSPTAHGSFAQCLREHGLPAAPGPVAGPPPGVDPATWQKAMQACSSLAPGPEG